MTTLNLYAVKDTKAASFSPPFTAQNDPVASRMCLASMSGPDNLAATWPADFELWCVGTFNLEDGSVFRDQYNNGTRFICNFAALLNAASASSGQGVEEKVA